MIGCLATGFFSSCGDNDDPDSPEATAKRTVLVYMCAENNLSDDIPNFYKSDSAEIVRGADEGHPWRED